MPIPTFTASAEVDLGLGEVARDAAALHDYLSYANELPAAAFPKKQLLDIAYSLMQLPEGTPAGARASLQYAQGRLCLIRRDYFGRSYAGTELAVSTAERSSALDQMIRNLIASVVIALNEYRRLSYDLDAGLWFDEYDRDLESGAYFAREGSFRNVLALSEALEPELESARAILEDSARTDSQRADHLKRQLSDALALNRLAQAELSMPRIVPKWLHKTSLVLRDYPNVIRHAIRALTATVDILEAALDRWYSFQRKFEEFGLQQLRSTVEAFDEAAGQIDRKARSNHIMTNSSHDIQLLSQVAVKKIAKVAVKASHRAVSWSSVVFLILAVHTFLPRQLSEWMELFSSSIQNSLK